MVENAIRVKNAEMMMIEATLDKAGKSIRIRFADGVSGSLPLSEIRSPEKLDLRRIELDNPYELQIGMIDTNEWLPIPWDFVRSYCEPSFLEEDVRQLESTRQQLGKRIKLLRQKKGFNSQQALADAADVGRVTLARIEAGSDHSPTMGTLEKIAFALSMDVVELLDVESGS